jgi:hypothetical protein
MRALSLCAVGAFIAFASHPAFAGDRYTQLHGSLCQPTNASRSIVEYSQYGIQNLSTSVGASVACPLPTTLGVFVPETVTAVGVTVYDRNNVADVWCNLKLLSSDGNVIWQDWRSSGGGGVGSGPQVLSFNPTGMSLGGFWTLECTLPAVQSPPWSSHVAAITIASHY